MRSNTRWILLLLVLGACRTPEPVVMPDPVPELTLPDLVHHHMDLLLPQLIQTGEPLPLPPGTEVKEIRIHHEKKSIEIFFNDRFSYIPLREEQLDQFYQLIASYLKESGEVSDLISYQLTMYSLEVPLHQLVPNYFRKNKSEYDFRRMPYVDKIRPLPPVRRVERWSVPQKGLEGRQIALWHSHGWIYDLERERWQWQRPRLFETVEDVLPMAFTIPYLIPMLENAGAHVWTPRERDIQKKQAIVDIDGSTGQGTIRTESASGRWDFGSPGFSKGVPPYRNEENPFMSGRYLQHPTSPYGNARIEWIPEIPQTGSYAVYISYATVDESADDAKYKVFHRGGITRFSVNQQIAGGTWVYLGTFEFEQGVHPLTGRVELTNFSEHDAIITADAVRLGGGMGLIERGGSTSERPRYLEAARYAMQYDGMPDTLVYRLSEVPSDLRDDFLGRGEWVNYLKGAPYGPYIDRNHPGLGIPIDVSLAFHTDAGISRNDTVVGTLMIYSIQDIDSLGRFPDYVDRLANRDLADILQSQLVDDIRARWDPSWVRRPMLNRRYSEAIRPNVPAVLLELLSHQNFLDMQFAQDPRFRFDVSRSIYKSTLKFLSDRYQQEYVVQPLPVSHFRIVPLHRGKVLLRWQPVSDPLEPTADPDRYIVYQRKANKPFDSGRMTYENSYMAADLEPGEMYEFKVIAVNDGGKSFPSEILSVSVSSSGRKPLLIINGFERVSGPARIEQPGFEGFARFMDPGVPDRLDLHFTGNQYNFDPSSKFASNEMPGHGASHADYETTVLTGNQFNYPSVSGFILKEAGIPFVSASVASIRDRKIDLTDYEAVFLILGNQKTTMRPGSRPTVRDADFQVFPGRLREELERYLQMGGRLFISGSHVGSDPAGHKHDDPEAEQFIRLLLGYTSRSDHASSDGRVYTVGGGLLPDGLPFSFNTGQDTSRMAAFAPDAIEPWIPRRLTESDVKIHSTDGLRGTGGVPEILFRYTETGYSAAVGYRNEKYSVVTFGFPFETINGLCQQTEVLLAVIQYLGLYENR